MAENPVTPSQKPGIRSDIIAAFGSGHSLTKARNPVTHLQKAAITLAMASNQVVEWYLPQIERLHYEGSVPCKSDVHH